MGGEYPEDPPERPASGRSLPSVSTGKTNNEEVNLKASQVIARIGAAGWKKIRSEGSHVIFEHPKYGRRSTAFGRPQRDVNKRRLVEVIEDFHLAEIETARIEARLAESRRRPEPARATLARIVPEPTPEMSDQDIRLLWAQLHKEHGYTVFKLVSDLPLNSGDLMDLLHHGKSLRPSDRDAVVAYMATRERQHNLTRDRAVLLKKGYGARIGSSNAVDPFIPVVREAIQKTLDAGVRITELAETIGIGASVIYGIKSGKSKTIHPEPKAKLQKWVGENWAEEEKPEPPQEQEPTHDVEAREYAALQVSSIDDELVAIQIVLKAIQPLKRNVAMRALGYVLERIREG
jgi:predicted RNA binding protein YcfA (HicA-like mRNA interferase family)